MNLNSLSMEKAQRINFSKFQGFFYIFKICIGDAVQHYAVQKLFAYFFFNLNAPYLSSLVDELHLFSTSFYFKYRMLFISIHIDYRVRLKFLSFAWCVRVCACTRTLCICVVTTFLWLLLHS